MNHLIIAEQIKRVERGSLCLCLSLTGAFLLISMQGQLILAPDFLQASQSHIGV